MRTTRAALTVIATVTMILPSSASASAAWRIEHDGGFNGAIDLSAAPDGSRLYVVGETDVDPQRRDYLTLGLDAATGAVIWDARYGQVGTYNEPAGVVTDPSGARVFVTGTGLGDSWSGTVTVAYDAATGAELWHTASGGYGYDGSGTGIASSPSGGRVFVSGSTHDGRFTTTAYGASVGSQLWSRHLAGHRSKVHHDAALAVAVSSDGGSVFVTGRVLDRKEQGAENVMTVAYRARDGRLLWAGRYNGAWRGAEERGTDIVSIGDVAIVTVDGTKTSALLAYDAATGSTRWTMSWSERSGPLFHPQGIDAGHGRAFVTGRVPGADGSYRTRTIAFSPTSGRLVWKANRAGGVPSDLAVDPSQGTLYVSKTDAAGGSVVGYRADDGTVIGTATDPGLTWSGVLTADPAGPDIFIAWVETSDLFDYHIVVARTSL